MDKLKRVIEQYGRWTTLTTYTDRIEAFIESDFSIALENAKSILETIAKEICKAKDVTVESSASINSVMKKAFKAIGLSNTELVSQISSSLATIGQKIGELRNDIGSTSHGMNLHELQERNTKIDGLSRDFLVDSTVIVACFLIRTFENENPRNPSATEEKLQLSEQEDFNNFWDETYGEFVMGDYSYPASEILYNVDYPAYKTECKAFAELEEGDE